MTAFEIQHPFPDPETTSCSDSDDESDFEVDSDVSDADLLELQRELKKLNPDKIKR
jgi:hypothetical protein